MKKALVIGATGQDGSLLCRYLLGQGYDVHGTFRRGSTDKFWRINEMQIREKLQFHNYNVGNELAFAEILRIVEPDEIYSLAGESFTALSFEEPKHFMNINIDSVVEQLDSIKSYSPRAKVFFASSSEIYGKSDPMMKLNENSLTQPRTPYGISKLTQLHLVRLYREKYGLELYTGILFPHESPYRSSEFVTRKITLGLIHRIKGKGEPLIMGDLSMVRDWGAASQYVEWMHKLLNNGLPGEFVFGSGVNSTVESYLYAACQILDVEIDKDVSAVAQGVTRYFEKNTKKLIATADVKNFAANRFSYGAADRSKLENAIGPQDSIPLEFIAKEMTSYELTRLTRSSI